MSITNEALDVVYEVLNKYINESLNELQRPSCDVRTQLEDKITKNLVVIEEIDNRISSATTRYEETISALSFEINIYCPNDIVTKKEIDGKEQIIAISKMEQARELRKLVDEVMGGYYKMQRTFCQPTPNIDNTIYRITMRYGVRVNDNKLKFRI